MIEVRVSCRFRDILAVLLFLIFAGCASSVPEGMHENDSRQLRLTILHTNDHHGRFWQNANGEYGLAARKTLVDQIRKEVAARGGHVLLLDAGDINTGVPESSMLHAEPDIKGMNLLGYDAMALGNHEFDNPLAILQKQQSWMNFPLLSANVYRKTGHRRLYQAYEELTFDRVKIAILGLTTEDSAKQANPENIKDIDFENAIDTARRMVPELRQKADIIICLTHMGYYADAKHESHAPGSVSLARAVPGIDVIVDGHTHEVLPQPDRQNGTIVVQAGEYGKFLGRLDLRFDNGRLVEEAYRLIPVNLKQKTSRNGVTTLRFIDREIAEDPQMRALLSTYEKGGKGKLAVVIGTSRDEFTGDRHIVRNNQAAIGQLLCKAAMEKTSADVAIFNSGGIRAGLPAGELTFKDILQVLPFGNTLCLVSLNGNELRRYLETVLGMAKDTGGYAQISGITASTAGQKIDHLSVGATPLDAKRQYLLVLPSYLAAGGDGYPVLTDHPGFVDSGYLDADVVREFISAHSPLVLNEFPLESSIK